MNTGASGDADSASSAAERSLPPVLGRLLSGTFWLALRTPIQALFAFWSVPLLIGAFGRGAYGAFTFAWGFGFVQFLLEFGMSSALQRQVAERWAKGDREGVDRTLTCGALFYTAVAVIQALTLIGVAVLALPATEFSGANAQLIVMLLWLQAITAPSYGLTILVSSVLQAARRYDVLPRFELLIVISRFLVILLGIGLGGLLYRQAMASQDLELALGWLGYRAGAGFLMIVVVQTTIQIALGLGPGLWVMFRELNYVPRLIHVSLGDFRNLTKMSFYMFLIQMSVVLADKVDTAVLGFALPDPDEAVAAYAVVSKPFIQVRQMGWMLAYLVLPAVASLAAADDRAGMDRLKYDGARLHGAAVLPVGLLAAIHAAPFLELWVGAEFPGRVPELAWLLRLFLIAVLPLLIAVHVQMVTGLGKVAVVALAALTGAVVNLPLSYILTLRLGISGVIWGTVLTTLFSNLLIPGIYAFRVLDMSIMVYLRRTLLAPALGALGLVGATVMLNRLGFPSEPGRGGPIQRAAPLLIHLLVACLAYVGGYLLAPVGRGDLRLVLHRLAARWR